MVLNDHGMTFVWRSTSIYGLLKRIDYDETCERKCRFEVMNICQHRTAGRNNKQNMPRGSIHKSPRESRDCSSRWTLLMTCLKLCTFFSGNFISFWSNTWHWTNKTPSVLIFWGSRTCKTFEVWEFYHVVIFNIIYTDRKYYLYYLHSRHCNQQKL